MKSREGSMTSRAVSRVHYLQTMNRWALTLSKDLKFNAFANNKKAMRQTAQFSTADDNMECAPQLYSAHLKANSWHGNNLAGFTGIN
jgi:hypothetical protein